MVIFVTQFSNLSIGISFSLVIFEKMIDLHLSFALEHQKIHYFLLENITQTFVFVTFDELMNSKNLY